MTEAFVLAGVIAGTLVAAGTALFPGLHAYNLLGLFMIGVHGGQVSLPAPFLLSFSIALVCGWSLLNTLPSILLSAPDESAIFTVLPGQSYLMQGRGHEAVMLVGAGGLIGILFLIGVIAPSAPHLLPGFNAVLRPHLHWVLWVVILFVLMSEWPKGGNLEPTRLGRFVGAWTGLFAGLLTFMLSGLMGFVLLYRSPVSAEVAFQNIMPALVGLFAVPGCLMNLMSGAEMPEQSSFRTFQMEPSLLFRAAVAGGLGGIFAAFFPGITGGVGGLLAGHATAQRSARLFLVSQGVCKVVYYVGALLFFFVPGVTLTRGGGAWMLRGLHRPNGWGDYFLVLGSIAFSGALAFILMAPLSRLMLRLLPYMGFRLFSTLALILMVAMVWGITGVSGLAILTVGTGIGLIPILFGSRRLNALGLLLLPIACNLSGVGPAVASSLGLL